MHAGATSGRQVVRVITRLNVGGPARQALLLCRELAGEFPTTLLAGRPAPDEGELRDPSVPVKTVPLVRPVSPREDAAAFRAVRAAVAAARPAIVHTHMAKAGSVGRLAVRSLRAPRPRTVHTFHGHVLDGYFRPGVQRAFTATERWLARRTDVLVAVSAEVQDELLDLGIGRASQFRLIPVGLDLDDFLAVSGPTGRLRSSLAIPPDAPLVGIIGRLVPIKAVDVLIDALALIPDAHVAVVGDGEERSRLEARAAAAGLAARVHFTGWTDDVPAALADCDVVALTSRNEGTPVALIEALAASRPVVATRVGGVPSVVLPDRTGLLVPPDDPPALAAAITRLLTDPALAARLASTGRVHVRDTYGAARLLRDIRALYAELTS
ncbi:MAG TPA: glycosyltransferase [Acidimicrobiales bacterium]